METTEIIRLVVVVIIGMTISLIAIRFYVFICDSIFGGVKRLFGFKKKKINWHTLEGTTEQKKVEPETTTDINSDINNRF